MTTSYKKNIATNTFTKSCSGSRRTKDSWISGLLDSSDDVLLLDPGVWVGGSFLLLSLGSLESCSLLGSCKLPWNSRKKANWVRRWKCEQMEANKNIVKGTFHQWYMYWAIETLNSYIGRVEKKSRINSTKVCLEYVMRWKIKVGDKIVPFFSEID